MVMAAVATLFGEVTDWANCKKLMSDKNAFINRIRDYDQDNVSAALMKKVRKYTSKEQFRLEHIIKKSMAAADIAHWVLYIDQYAAQRGI